MDFKTASIDDPTSVESFMLAFREGKFQKAQEPFGLEKQAAVLTQDDASDRTATPEEHADTDSRLKHSADTEINTTTTANLKDGTDSIFHQQSWIQGPPLETIAPHNTPAVMHPIRSHHLPSISADLTSANATVGALLSDSLNALDAKLLNQSMWAPKAMQPSSKANANARSSSLQAVKGSPETSIPVVLPEAAHVVVQDGNREGQQTVHTTTIAVWCGGCGTKTTVEIPLTGSQVSSVTRDAQAAGARDATTSGGSQKKYTPPHLRTIEEAKQADTALPGGHFGADRGRSPTARKLAPARHNSPVWL